MCYLHERCCSQHIKMYTKYASLLSYSKFVSSKFQFLPPFQKWCLVGEVKCTPVISVLGSRKQHNEERRPALVRTAQKQHLVTGHSVKTCLLDMIFRTLYICSTSSQTKPEGCVEVCGCVCVHAHIHTVGTKPRTSLPCAKQVLRLWGFFPP